MRKCPLQMVDAMRFSIARANAAILVAVIQAALWNALLQSYIGAFRAIC